MYRDRLYRVSVDIEVLSELQGPPGLHDSLREIYLKQKNAPRVTDVHRMVVLCLRRMLNGRYQYVPFSLVWDYVLLVPASDSPIAMLPVVSLFAPMGDAGQSFRVLETARERGFPMVYGLDKRDGAVWVDHREDGMFERWVDFVRETDTPERRFVWRGVGGNLLTKAEWNEWTRYRF